MNNSSFFTLLRKDYFCIASEIKGDINDLAIRFYFYVTSEATRIGILNSFIQYGGNILIEDKYDISLTKDSNIEYIRAQGKFGIKFLVEKDKFEEVKDLIDEIAEVYFGIRKILHSNYDVDPIDFPISVRSSSDIKIDGKDLRLFVEENFGSVFSEEEVNEIYNRLKSYILKFVKNLVF